MSTQKVQDAQRAPETADEAGSEIFDLGARLLVEGRSRERVACEMLGAAMTMIAGTPFAREFAQVLRDRADKIDGELRRTRH